MSTTINANNATAATVNNATQQEQQPPTTDNVVGVVALDNAASDSGRESVNEFDASLDETQLCKKHCVGSSFYTSSGSQTKWYLEPAATVENAAENSKTSITAQTSLELPSNGIANEITLFTVAATKTTTRNDAYSVANNTKHANLSHQMRAVSSPSLTDALQQEMTKTTTNCTSANSSTMQLAAAAAADGDKHIATSLPTSASNNNCSANRHATTMTTSQSVGVLQKFKRTLTSFNKNQNQQQATAANLLAPESELTQAATASSTDITDAAAGKYRFGPLIWRTSKERRKTKYNRRDKCNSGDSGIQIELENDEQFARAIAAGAGVNLSTTALKTNDDDDETASKLHGVRRTNSAKTTSITDATALNAKARILRKIEVCAEREAPESLPTRSLSQPNGLDTCGAGKGDLEDSDSDSVASHDEGPNYYPIYAEVLYSFTAAGPQELGLERGTLIEILRKEVGPWWFGRIKKEDASLVEEILDPELGWFPKEFVRVIQYPETDTFFLAHMSQTQQQQQQQTQPPMIATTTVPSTQAPAPPTLQQLASNVAATVSDQNNVTTIVIEASTPTHDAAATLGENNALLPSRSVNVIMDNADILRRSAIKELLDTEVNYVKLLAAICDGYLPAMSKRIDIFSPHSIRLIFSNITAIYKFQRKFLEALRKGIEQNQIAKVFLKMHKGFLCYSTYCNAYPRALIELESYDRVKDARTILDNCRESENLAELPLSAHLLAPVQRICRYPLHLGEIIKTAVKSVEGAAPASDLQQLEQCEASQLNIPDTHETIAMALEAMKSITEAVNEGKRHSETIARHQASFQNFKGPPLHLHSTRFFLQIDATRQKQNIWNSSCTLFLFDNQLIYCKRDIIKRSQFIYKGRIFLDRCRVVNVRDGKMFGHTIKNSLRIYCESRDKWFDFSFRSANRKLRFLNTLALERQFGGKALYVSEMTGFEYAFDERDYSDQSDYDMPDSDLTLSAGGLPASRLREYVYDVATGTTTTTNTSASGESSVPESPAKAYKYSDTLPKKSSSAATTQTRDSSVASSECNTGSLGRRRLGNWFRKPKSSNCTPNHSPTHKPMSQSSTELPTLAVDALLTPDMNATLKPSTAHGKELTTSTST